MDDLQKQARQQAVVIGCYTKGHYMRTISIAFLLFFILTQVFGQTQRKVSTYLLTQYTNTIHDRTIGNNPWGIGLGLQTYFNTKPKFKLVIDLTGDIYLEDDKVFRANADGTEIPTVNGMTNLFVGTSYHPAQNIYLSIVGGPSFISGQTLPGIKSSFGFYFSTSKNLTGKISYINIFNRDKTTREDFTSLSIAIGLKLF